MTCKMDALHVARRVIEQTMSCEVVETSLPRLELEANQSEGFARYQSNLRESSESLSWVLEDLEVNRCVRGILNLNSLEG